MNGGRDHAPGKNKSVVPIDENCDGMISGLRLGPGYSSPPAHVQRPLHAGSNPPELEKGQRQAAEVRANKELRASTSATTHWAI